MKIKINYFKKIKYFKFKIKYIIKYNLKILKIINS